MSKFSIVMPITQYSYLLPKHKKPTKDHNNFDRFIQIGLPTYLMYLQWHDVLEFIVIVPLKEHPAFHTKLKQALQQKLDILSKFKVIPQEHIIGDVHTTKSRIQMLSKLLVANIVQTPHYLLVDDDVILLRPFGFSQLFTDKTQKYLKFTPDHAKHKDWWTSSSSALGIDIHRVWPTLQTMRKKNWIVNVTPQVLVTDVVKDLWVRLRDKMELLSTMRGEWTEYTLYWLHLMDTQQLTKLYRGSRVRISDGSKSVWYACNDLEGAIREMARNPYQYFGVIQSNVPEHTITAVKTAILKNRPSF